MNYRFAEMTAAEIALIGEALDLLPHGRVALLVRKMQGQITAQDSEAKLRETERVAPAKEPIAPSPMPMRKRK